MNEGFICPYARDAELVNIVKARYGGSLFQEMSKC